MGLRLRGPKTIRAAPHALSRSRTQLRLTRAAVVEEGAASKTDKEWCSAGVGRAPKPKSGKIF